MERYVTRPGVVLCSVCGEYLLVAAKEAREHCPYVTQINPSSAFLWKQLNSGGDLESLVQAVGNRYDIDDRETVYQSVQAFLDQMLELGYLLRKGEEQ